MLLTGRLDFRRLPGPVFDPPEGSFSRTAAGNRACWLVVLLVKFTSTNQKSTTQIWVVTRHQYRISALVSQTSFCGETSGGAPRNVGCFLKLSANLLASFFSKILFFWNESFATTRSSFSLEKNKNVFNFNNLLFHASLSLLLKKLMVIPVL